MDFECLQQINSFPIFKIGGPFILPELEVGTYLYI